MSCSKEPRCAYLKPKLTLAKNVGQGFFLCYTPLKLDCLTALVDEDVSSGYYVQ
jgi:hypothetical protein